jgi:hypothetical protein
MNYAWRRLRSVILPTALATITWLAACTETVYQDRPPFNPPPDASSGMLGYYTVDEHQTTCGNCHVGQQIDWVKTKHSNACADLQASGKATATCEGCHTLNSRGNQPKATIGYEKVKDNVYHDVQCESCHGPGETHVENPTPPENRPIASINVFPSVPVSDTAAVINSSCGACHQAAGPSQNHNYLKEWRASRHGQLRASQAANASCQPCHEGKGALRAWGINTLYKELNTNILIPQTCAVCHDPHGTATDAQGNPLEGQLRFPIGSPIVEENLCTKCHNRIPEATPSNSRGPHGAQGPVLFGTAGYFPPGTSYDTAAIFTSHGSSANPRMCAGCHVNKLTGVDAQGTRIDYVGHTFHPLPCLMAGLPGVVDTTFTNDCAYTETARSWGACTKSGCHATAAIAAQRLAQMKNEKEAYVNTLWVDTDGDQTLDAFPTDQGYLAKIKKNAPNDLDFTNAPYNTILTPAKGALFNAQLLGEKLTGHPDGSHGVHNPFLYRALLQSSIADMLAHYPTFLPAPPPDVLSGIEAAIRSGELKLPPQTERAVMDAYRAAQGVR